MNYLFDRFALAVKKIDIEVIYSVGSTIDIGDLVILQGFKLIQWKGDGKGTRGLPVVGTDKYGIVDSSYWGNYQNTYEGNGFLADYNSPPDDSIEVKELITIGFFQGLLENYNYNVAFLAQHNVPRP